MPNLGGWHLHFYSDDPAGPVKGAQCWPANDLREHVDDPSCWCRPVRLEEFDDSLPWGYWTHNALDQRERYENGAKPS